SSIFKRISVRGLLKPLALVGENTINGGLLGSAKNSKISRVSSNLTIRNGDVIGGIAGQLTNSSIEEASATIDVSFDGSFGQPPGSYEMPRITGGIVGFADCASGTCSNSIKKVYSSGTMNAGGTFGGILGRNALPSTLQLTEISDVRADVNVIFQSIPLVYNYGAYGRGGIVGHNLTGSLTVANALFSGSALFDPKVFPQTFGGIIGTPGTSSASVASFFDKSKTAHAVDSSGGMARSSAQLKSISNYSGWNISADANSTGTWILPSASYPMLNGGIQPGTCEDTFNY
ncbi:MAG: hypothetical protein J0M12_13590, partial [Deltaproteobacteria bacterium]|nr:hypothetical protein [Deltaproteobacteria bacterium]